MENTGEFKISDIMEFDQDSSLHQNDNEQGKEILDRLLASSHSDAHNTSHRSFKSSILSIQDPRQSKLGDNLSGPHGSAVEKTLIEMSFGKKEKQIPQSPQNQPQVIVEGVVHHRNLFDQNQKQDTLQTEELDDCDDPEDVLDNIDVDDYINKFRERLEMNSLQKSDPQQQQCKQCQILKDQIKQLYLKVCGDMQSQPQNIVGTEDQICSILEVFDSKNQELCDMEDQLEKLKMKQKNDQEVFNQKVQKFKQMIDNQEKEIQSVIQMSMQDDNEIASYGHTAIDRERPNNLQLTHAPSFDPYTDIEDKTPRSCFENPSSENQTQISLRSLPVGCFNSNNSNRSGMSKRNGKLYKQGSQTKPNSQQNQKVQNDYSPQQYYDSNKQQLSQMNPLLSQNLSSQESNRKLPTVNRTIQISIKRARTGKSEEKDKDKEQEKQDQQQPEKRSSSVLRLSKNNSNTNHPNPTIKYKQMQSQKKLLLNDEDVETYLNKMECVVTVLKPPTSPMKHHSTSTQEHSTPSLDLNKFKHNFNKRRPSKCQIQEKIIQDLEQDEVNEQLVHSNHAQLLSKKSSTGQISFTNKAGSKTSRSQQKTVQGQRYISFGLQKKARNNGNLKKQ